MEPSVKYFNRFDNCTKIAQVRYIKVIENDEILETERGNSSPSSNSNSKQKEKLKQNL